MSRAFTVNDVVDEVRSLIDEYNTNQVDTTADILPSLRRAQEKAYQTLSRVYYEPIMDYVEITGVVTQEYKLPENIWEDKILRVEWIHTEGAVQRVSVCQNVPTHSLSVRQSGLTSTAAPELYTLFSRTLRFSGIPNGSRTLRIWKLREIETPVLVLGRITNTDYTTNTVYLTEVSEDFNPEGSLDNFDHYVNVIDGQTGEIRSTLQILSWDGTDTLRFKGTADRATVLNRTIAETIDSITVSADDYICHIKGSCVLYFMEVVHGFIVQYSVAELKRKLGYAYDVDQQLIKDFEADLKRAYMGRDSKMKIRHTNPNWLKGTRRRFYRGVPGGSY
jgi:hypothetical protein